MVTGRARVVLDPVGAELEPGEILVAPSTDPGWTPLFPAVVGVPDATTRIVSGQLVTVDGAAGLVLTDVHQPDAC
jgi:pyruvate,water dikinase